MILTLEIFGPFQESSVHGLYRGLIATVIILAGAWAWLRTSKHSKDPPSCFRILLLAILFASGLTVLRRGTRPPQAAVYGGLVGAVIGGALGATAARSSDFLLLTLGAGLLGAAASGAAYWADGVASE